MRPISVTSGLAKLELTQLLIVAVEEAQFEAPERHYADYLAVLMVFSTMITPSKSLKTKCSYLCGVYDIRGTLLGSL